MWGLFVAIGGFIAGLFQGGIDAIVTFLAWAVAALQAGAILLWNGLKAAVDLARIGFVKVWDFFKPLYDDILKPAWQTFWRWFDKLRAWLDQTFGPLLKWLRDLRTELLKFWSTYVRPWLDLIDVTRKLLRTLASLGLTWARALDQRLGDIENAIEAPFRFVLSKLNEIINVVNTVAGKDGLLQRVALIRSIARDYQYTWRAIVNPLSRVLSGDQEQQLRGALATRAPDKIAADLSADLAGDDGDNAAVVDEWAEQLRIYLVS